MIYEPSVSDISTPQQPSTGNEGNSREVLSESDAGSLNEQRTDTESALSGARSGSTQ